MKYREFSSFHKPWKARQNVDLSGQRIQNETINYEGISIGAEYHDRIFEIVEELHAGDDEPEADAAGVGLAVCERIIERHGGEIWVDSEPGEGATFSFTVPAAGERGD